MINDISYTLNSTVTAVPLENVTLTVTPSANFNLSSYSYQWRLEGANIAEATNSSYVFNAATVNGFSSYTCAVSGLSLNGTLIYGEVTSPILVRVVADTSIFARHTPKGANHLNESGKERYTRIRNLGYC